MHRRRRHPSASQRPQNHKAPPGFRLSVATFAAGIAAALVMIGANADESHAAAPQEIGTAHVALTIGR
ncbi:MAG: hypothetical protein ACK4PH_08560 [Aquincola tertiaricarbonis]|uniref:hypothetical protein n=1 Tax=Aquincola tertiaricarbonis TaxID=391953 RepID=UPI000614C3D8|nr:hypothetical protein [Aquincola tertiaricarbonis]